MASLAPETVAAYRAIADPAAVARAGLFVAEGRLVVQRLLTSRKFTTRSLLVTPVAFAAIRASIPSDVPCHVVDQSEMDQIVGFNIHRGCLALAERPLTPALDDIPLDEVGRVVVLEGVNNPDNVGGIFRSAAAFGVDLIVLGPRCGDPFYRKAIRTSMGATLDVPFAAAGDWPGALERLRAYGVRILALTTATDARALDEVSREPQRTALVLGTEGSGLTAEAAAAADARVRIRMTDRVDSLNVTVAASIAMHHVF